LFDQADFASRPKAFRLKLPWPISFAVHNPEQESDKIMKSKARANRMFFYTVDN
jgi:hypothetical protein